MLGRRAFQAALPALRTHRHRSRLVAPFHRFRLALAALALSSVRMDQGEWQLFFAICTTEHSLTCHGLTTVEPRSKPASGVGQCDHARRRQ